MAQWFPNEEIIVSGDSAYGGQSILSHLPPNVHLISHVHPNGALYKPAPPKKEKCKGPAGEKGDRLPGMKQWADDPDRPWTKLKFNQFGLYATLEVKTIQALYYKAGKDRLLTIVLTRGLEGKRPDQMFYCTKLDWTAEANPLGLRFTAGPLNAPLKIASSSWAWRTLPIVFPKAIAQTAPLALLVRLSGHHFSFHQTGHQLLRFPFPALVHQEGRTIVCRHVDDPEAG